MLCLPTATQCVYSFDLFTYCTNNAVNDIDVLGRLSAKQAAAFLNPLAIFNMFLIALLVNYGKGLLTVSGYVTIKISPPVLKAFWWKPWLAAAIIAAALLIILASVAIIFSKQQDEINRIKRRIPNKLMKNGKVDLSQFTNRNGPKGPKGGRGILGPLGWYILKDIDQHKGSVWKLFNKIGERIASLLSDGTIVGK